ncbi:MAG TPA: hypothetical protein VF069_16475 [Streptosporangiaceae bacterium]
MSDVRRGVRAVPGAHRRWILINAVGVTACVNLLLNAGIATVSVIGVDTVPVWSTPLLGGPSIIADMVGTLFTLPLITCLICTTSVWLELRRGRLAPLTWPGVAHSPLDRLPAGRLRRGLVLGAVTTFMLGPPAIGVVVALRFDALSAPAFVVFKVAFAIGLGALVTPVIALRAMADGGHRDPRG